MTSGRDPSHPAPDHLADRSRHSDAATSGPRSAGDAADLALTFRASGPAYASPVENRVADDSYEFHAQSWFTGPGVGGLVEAARSGSWDPLVDPLPSAEAPAVAPVTDGHCVAPIEDPEEALPPVVRAIGVRPAPRRHRKELTEGWARAALTATQPVDLDGWFRPADASGVLTQPVDLAELFAQDDEAYADHPSGPLPQTGIWPPQGEIPDSPAKLAGMEISDAYDVTLTGALGLVELGFRGGFWYSITESSARLVTVTEAMRVNPELSSQITQLVCWWMRQHPMSDRALDLATELSMAVSELARP